MTKIVANERAWQSFSNSERTEKHDSENYKLLTSERFKNRLKSNRCKGPFFSVFIHSSFFVSGTTFKQPCWDHREVIQTLVNWDSVVAAGHCLSKSYTNSPSQCVRQLFSLALVLAESQLNGIQKLTQESFHNLHSSWKRIRWGDVHRGEGLV